jgi:hypothetical protein
MRTTATTAFTLGRSLTNSRCQKTVRTTRKQNRNRDQRSTVADPSHRVQTHRTGRRDIVIPERNTGTCVPVLAMPRRPEDRQSLDQKATRMLRP